MWLCEVKILFKNKIRGVKTSTPLMLPSDPLFAVTVDEQKELRRAPGRQRAFASLARACWLAYAKQAANAKGKYPFPFGLERLLWCVCRVKDLLNSLCGSVRVFASRGDSGLNLLSGVRCGNMPLWPFLHTGGFLSSSGLCYARAMFGRVVCQSVPYLMSSTFQT